MGGLPSQELGRLALSEAYPWLNWVRIGTELGPNWDRTETSPGPTFSRYQTGTKLVVVAVVVVVVVAAGVGLADGR